MWQNIYAGTAIERVMHVCLPFTLLLDFLWLARLMQGFALTNWP